MSKERKKKEIILTRDNIMILPLIMTEASITPSLIGNRISVKLLKRLQEPFKQVITDHKQRGGWQLSLFDTPALRDKYLKDNKIMFELHMGELVDASKNYQQAFDFVCKIKDIKVLVPIFDEIGNCVNFIRESLYDVVLPGDTEVRFSIRSSYTDNITIVDTKRMRLVDYLDYKPVAGFEVDEDSIQFRYKKGTEPVVGISVEKRVAEHIFNLRGKYGRILDEVILSSNNKYFANIYQYLASRKERGIIEVDYLSWKRKMLGEEGGEELKGYKKFAQFNKAILKKVLDEMQSMGEEGIDCWVDKVEKVYLHGERAENPDKLRFHMHITKLGKELYEEKKTDAQMIEMERRLGSEFGQNEVQVYSISKKVPKECLPEMLAKMDALLKKKSDKIKDWQSYCNKSLMSAVADFQKQAEDAKKKEEEMSKSAKVMSKPDEEEKSMPVLTEEDLAKWMQALGGIRERVGEQLYSTWIVCMDLEKVEPNVLTIRVPNMVVKQFIENEIYSEVKEALKNAFGVENVVLTYK